MANTRIYINNQVKDGNDIIFGEHHGTIDSTFSMMGEAIIDNPNSISAVSLEFPEEVQPLLDRAQSGDIEREQFIREMRITMEQSYLDIAYDLLNQNSISEDQYSDYADVINGKIDGVVNGVNEFYTEEQQSIDDIALGELYNLSRIAGSANIPVYASDLDREFVVLSDLDISDLDDWANRIDDTSDFNLLSKQVDLQNSGVILAHRGVAHLHNQNGATVGLDDYLENSGREVTVIGNYGSIETMSDVFNNMAEYGITINDGSDYTVVQGDGYGMSDMEMVKNHNMGMPGP